MNFNPDTSKQAQGVLFSRKGYCSSSTCSTIIQYMKPKASWNVSSFFLENMLNKANKTIGLLRKLQNTLPRLSLLTIYKSFIRPHIDYGNIIYDLKRMCFFNKK